MRSEHGKQQGQNCIKGSQQASAQRKGRATERGRREVVGMDKRTELEQRRRIKVVSRGVQQGQRRKKGHRPFAVDVWGRRPRSSQGETARE